MKRHFRVQKMLAKFSLFWIGSQRFLILKIIFIFFTFLTMFFHVSSALEYWQIISWGLRQHFHRIQFLKCKYQESKFPLTIPPLILIIILIYFVPAISQKYLITTLYCKNMRTSNDKVSNRRRCLLMAWSFYFYVSHASFHFFTDKILQLFWGVWLYFSSTLNRMYISICK